MKKILYVPLAVFALALGSCSNEDDFGGQSAVQGNDVISAVAPSKDTRTSMNGNSVLWDGDDVIGVISTKSENDNVNTPYYLQKGAGTGSGDFLGMSAGEGYTKAIAYYPYNETVTYTAENGLLLTLPATYEYNAESPNCNNKAPMAGLIEQGAQDAIAFKNAGALLHIDLQNIPQNCTTIKLTSENNDPKLAGKAKITFADGIPTLAMADAGTTLEQSPSNDVTTASEGHTITITFENAEAGTNKSFYFPLPVANYSSLTVSVEGKDGFNSQTLKEKALDAERGVRHTTTLAFDGITGTIPTEVETVEEITNTLAVTNAVTVAEVKDASTGGPGGGSTAPEIALPKVAAGAVTAESVSIAFGKISTDNIITIKEGEGQSGTTDGAVAKEVNIAVPPTTTQEETGQEASKAPKVAVQLPNSTVTLSANGEKATFAEVTASTAENTLIVNNEVTITKLTVNKGNVRLKGNAKITELINSTGGKIKLYVEDAKASYPDNLGDSVIVIKSPEDELAVIAANGGTYTLEADLTGDFVVSAKEAVIINLNGHKITNKSGDTFIVNHGSELTINGNGTVDNVTHGQTCIYNNGTVTLNGGEYTRSKETGASTTVSGGNSYYNILNHGVMTINAGVKVISSGAFSSLIANGYYDYGNTNARTGYVSGTNHVNPSLTINGGTFSGGINTIKNDDGATLTIANGTFTNTTQATVQNNHIATISGGTFTPIENASHVIESRYGDATYDLGQTTISGGTFNGQLYLSGGSPSLTISGGTFSDPHALDYLTTGATVNVRLLADTELAKSVVMTTGTATFDLQKHTLTAAADAKVPGTSHNGNVAIAVKAGAKLTVQNGSIGNSSKGLLYGVYAFGTGDVTLSSVLFSERITYAYGGAGKLTATSCTFQGWLSGWHQGGTFTNCTFTIGRNWYPATICYGNTTFSACKFFNNGTDADEYDSKGPDSSDGYYRCNYVVAACNPTTTIGFTNCSFMSANGTLTNISANNHPYHACGGWGDGKTPNANITVDSNAVTTKCSKAPKAAQ